MSDIVERTRAAMEGTSPGPWKMGDRRHPDVVIAKNGCLWHPRLGVINHRADGEFIAAARTLVPELVAEIERLRCALCDHPTSDHTRFGCVVIVGMRRGPEPCGCPTYEVDQCPTCSGYGCAECYP